MSLEWPRATVFWLIETWGSYDSEVMLFISTPQTCSHCDLLVLECIENYKKYETEQKCRQQVLDECVLLKIHHFIDIALAVASSEQTYPLFFHPQN